MKINQTQISETLEIRFLGIWIWPNLKISEAEEMAAVFCQEGGRLKIRWFDFGLD